MPSNGISAKSEQVVRFESCDRGGGEHMELLANQKNKIYDSNHGDDNDGIQDRTKIREGQAWPQVWINLYPSQFHTDTKHLPNN